MNRVPSAGKSCCLFLLALLLLDTSVCLARTAVLEVDRIGTPLARIEGMKLTLDWPVGAEHGQMRLQAALLDAGELGYRWRALDGQCELRGEAAAGWQCSGKVAARGAKGLDVSFRIGDDALALSLGTGPSKIALSRTDEAAPLALELVRMPIIWLQPLLAQAWGDGRITGGQVDAQWQIDAQDESLALGGPLTVGGLGLDTPDGTLAAEGVSAAGKLAVRLDEAQTTVDVSFDLGGGELLAGPLYLALPAHAVSLGARMTRGDDGPWRVESLRWRDPGVLELDGAFTLDPAAQAPLRAGEFRVALPDLVAANARYFESLNASFGLSGLSLGGRARIAASLDQGDWQALDLTLENLELEDGSARFGVTRANGDLRLRRGAAPADGELSWAGAHAWGLSLGEAHLPLRSAAAGLALREPVAIDLLGGTLRLNTLNYAPRAQDERFDLSLALEDADLALLSAALGWPPFTGRISGELPAVHYENQRLDLAGGLGADLFDGRVDVSQLSMERPFGVAPMLSASIDFSNLDLQPLTSAFGFGEITGRLDGRIHGLRLVDWEPAAFDASFHTVSQRGERQRISQRAVRELTEVGGGGLAAGLQAQMFKAFSSFGYSRIGLSCFLDNNVCTMGGLGPAPGGGYLIVDGSGLPRVNVVGHQQRVDWPVLLGRLKAASEGQMPVVD